MDTRNACSLLLTVATLTAGASTPGSNDVPASSPDTAGSNLWPAARRSTAPLGSVSPSADSPVPALRGRRIVLDPGHNGGNASHPHRIARLVDAGGLRKACNSVGAETGGGFPEHAFAFDVARRAAKLLRTRGAVVTLTRPDDAGVGPCVNVRAAVGNAIHADAVVSIHADGAPAHDSGFHVIEPGPAPDRRNRRILAPSARLASRLIAEFAAATGIRRATYAVGTVSPGLARRRDLAGLNLSRVPAVFIECGNMRNRTDGLRMTHRVNRQAMAAGIVRGIASYIATAHH